MSSQAEQLQQTMAFFRVGGASAPTISATPRAPRPSRASVHVPATAPAPGRKLNGHGHNGFALSSAALDETQFARF